MGSKFSDEKVKVLLNGEDQSTVCVEEKSRELSSETKNSSTWATKWFKRLVAYAKCNRDSYESELGKCLHNNSNEVTRDRPYHHRTTLLLDREATYACRTWTGFEDRSAAIEAHVKALEAHVATLLGRIHTLKARDLEPQDEPAEAGSSFVYFTMKMPPKRRTTTTSATTTPMTDAQIKELIERGVAAALAERDADRRRNSDDSHDSGTGREKNPQASKPKIMQEAIKFATELMDKKIPTLAEWPGEKKPYGGSKPLCPNCNYHHDGQCLPKYAKCKRTGHQTRDYRSPTAANNNQRAQGANQRVLTCFECGAQGYFKSNFPKLKNRNQGNQVGNGNAVARAYAVGNTRKNPYANVVTGTFLRNNHYDSILFDTGADRSFMSTAFSSLINNVPSILDHDYDVELANKKNNWSKYYHTGLHFKLLKSSIERRLNAHRTW
ncbi:putative reverse transcriptase domain-containing protein [Tanacetum coccineum]|uniref:Reverse transcriptase domain-containing protein n=1 Tax=Tanacetum coccineum TaxID=301880 RepID=A0ABQ5H5W1_9ASTR